MRLLLPRVCAGCQGVCDGEARAICQTCMAGFGATATGRSPAGIAVLGRFEGPLRNAIHALKFKGASAVAVDLAALLAPIAGSAFEREFASRRVGAVIAVPTSLHRARRRGYDQATLLASALATELGAPRSSRLVRVQRGSAVQTGAGATVRRSLVPAAFMVEGCPERRAIVIDDVVTSGATMRAAEALLNAAGVRTVPVAIAATPKNA